MAAAGAVQTVISRVASLAAITAAAAAVVVVASFAIGVVHGATVVHIRITSSCRNSIYTSMAATQSHTSQY